MPFTVSFDLYVIRSWDGNGPYSAGETWSLSVDGGPVLIDNTNFSNTEAVNPTQAYPDVYPTGDYPARQGAVENNTLGFTIIDNDNEIMDAVYHIEKTFLHSDDSLVLEFSGSGLQSNLLTGGVYDESWGIDNVSVIPEPATLMLLGVGSLIFRRKRN